MGDQCVHEFGEFEGIEACRYCGLAPWVTEDFEENDQSVEEFLDDADLARLEYDRIEQDLYPMGVEWEDSQDTNIGHVHTGDDPVQAWMAHQRREANRPD